MSATTHPIAPDELMAYLDCELLGERAQSISVHVENCANCQAFMASLRGTSHDLASWSIPLAPMNAKFENQLHVAAADASSKSSAAGDPRLCFFPRQRWKLVMACSVLVVLTIALIGITEGQYRMSLSKAMLAAARQGAEKKRGIDAVTFAPYINALPPSANSHTANDAERKLGNVAPSTGDKMSSDPQTRKSYRSWLTNDVSWITSSDPMIARTISLSIVTRDFDASRKSLDAVLTRHQGYSASLSVSTEQNAGRSLNASLRIPAAELTDAFAELKALGRVENETQNGEEVTQQHADLAARLKNSRETEQRLQSILIQRTGKISDVLEVEQEIARVRGQIEQMQAEQQTLEHRVDFATIDLKLAEEYKAQLSAPATSVSTQLHNALINGLRTAADSVLSLVLFFSETGPVLLLWLAILALPVLLLWRRYRHATAAI